MIVFVYGSLRKGFHNHSLLKHSQCVGEAQTKGTMYDLGAFPAVDYHSNQDVHGELYEIDEGTLARLDRLEGHPNFYHRVEVDTTAGPALMYVLEKDQLAIYPTIPSGDWAQRKEKAA